MINLLPPEGKKIIVREYALHVATSVSFLFGLVMLVLTVACVPTYVLVKAQIASLTDQSSKENDEKKKIEEINGELKKMNEVLAQLKSSSPSVNFTKTLFEIKNSASANITFKTFSFENAGIIQVQGIAAKREDLVRFKKDLESHPLFKTAEVPIADLAKDTELPFAIKVTLK